MLKSEGAPPIAMGIETNKLEFGDRVLIADHRRVWEQGPRGLRVKSVRERWRPATIVTWVGPTDTRAAHWIVEFDDNPEETERIRDEEQWDSWKWAAVN